MKYEEYFAKTENQTYIKEKLLELRSKIHGDAINLLSKLLAINPSERISAQ